MATDKEKGKTHITFQAPVELRDRIVALAKQNRRSKSGQLIAMLEDALGVEPGTYYSPALHSKPQ